MGTQVYNPRDPMRAGNGFSDKERGFTVQIENTGAGRGLYIACNHDSALGKFISPYSIVPNPAIPAHSNRFSYVRNNPLKYTDLTSHDDYVIKSVWFPDYDPFFFNYTPEVMD